METKLKCLPLWASCSIQLAVAHQRPDGAGAAAAWTAAGVWVDKQLKHIYIDSGSSYKTAQLPHERLD